MLRGYKLLSAKLSATDKTVGNLLDANNDAWCQLGVNKKELKNLRKEFDNIGDWMQDIDDVQMLHTVAIDELRNNVALILDHLGVEVVQPSDKPTIKKKGSK
jgi:hypothetical protein|nr:MAG TPA: hypothetical protein [Caudoviricetes sp.]